MLTYLDNLPPVAKAARQQELDDMSSESEGEIKIPPINGDLQVIHVNLS